MGKCMPSEGGVPVTYQFSGLAPRRKGAHKCIM